VNYDNELKFAKGLAREAGVVMKRYFRTDDLNTERKDDNSPITIADTAINRMVIDRVKASYAEYGVIGEEESHNKTAEYVWVCDPIDGTSSFMLGMPVSTFCLALVHKGRVLLSVVYDPYQDCLYYAVTGKGAFLNDTPLKVSSTSYLKGEYLLAPDVIGSDAEDITDIKLALRDRGARVVNLASFTYVALRVAEGKMPVAFMTYGSPWDAAAISLIVQEAGGKATDLNGKIRRYDEFANGIVLSNGTLHDEIIGIISGARSRH
jgi:fructose-1,6-bisphosphatase/inositol monophosphatase family enzyme